MICFFKLVAICVQWGDNIDWFGVTSDKPPPDEVPVCDIAPFLDVLWNIFVNILNTFGVETAPLSSAPVHDWQVEVNHAGFIGTRSLQPSVSVGELGKWSVTYVCVLISLALIWWQRLSVPAQWHKVGNPLTFSAFKPGVSPSGCWGVVEPDFQNPAVTSPKVCFIISPGCRFSSGNIKISETAVEVLLVWQRSDPM